MLYEDFREERRQLLDELVLGTAGAPPLPKLTQVSTLAHAFCVKKLQDDLTSSTETAGPGAK